MGRWMQWIVAAWFFAMMAPAAMAQAVVFDVGEMFKDPAKWGMTADAFVNEFQSVGFRLVDGRQTAMANDKQRLRFVGMEICEARVYFDQNGVRRVELSVYNKGDAGVMDKATFDGLVAAVKNGVIAFAQDAGTTGRTSNDRPNYFIRRHQWASKTPAVQLEWAYIQPHRSGGKNVEYSAEFIKVLMVPVKAGVGGLTALSGGTSAARVKTARTVKENVTRNPAGDVWIGTVPMVDQGQKGYCAASTSERVLRYYGLEIDQHQIAQLANTAAEGGTSLEGMAKAISRVGRQFQLDERSLISLDSSGIFDRSDAAKQIDQYNAVAKRKKAGTIDWKDFTEDHTVDIQGIWKAMDPEILLMARSGQKQGMGLFAKNIASYVDQGIPLLWACWVGMYPEEPPVQAGVFGHVRLIIGYNTMTKEVMYSDSWGPGHELKRLPLANAWAMTKGLIVLKPRDVR